jgi:hypothetical protein
LTFDIGAAPDGLRVLRLERGDNGAQWEVTDAST